METKLKVTNEWKVFASNILPASALKIFAEEGITRSGYGNSVRGGCLYRGDSPATATEWLITMDDGGYFKVHAEFCLWHKLDGKEPSMFCHWSNESLIESLNSLMEKGVPTRDPDYQT